uniref:Uncharacterized protein n=1 Tax=Fagus sylvatica TaxID=28930 RepID=A0A2N9I0J8_FAGSY
MNRSSDERVMAPGSRGIGAVFVHLSGEDSDQMGDAFGKPRVPRRSWSRYLSNAPGLVDQLVASRKDSAREGGYFDVLGTVGKLALPTFARKTLRASVATSVGKIPEISAQPYFVRPVFTRMVDIAPDVGFRQSWYRRKAGATYFPKVQALHRGELGFARYDPANGGRWNVPYAKGFDHNFLVSRPFWARKVSNRSSHYVLQNGPGAVVQRFGISVQTGWDIDLGTTQAQIGWFNGLESQSKQVEDDLTWGLPKLQIGCSTVWNLSPNRLRSDLTWGLPKLQIGWFQRFGISVQTG